MFCDRQGQPIPWHYFQRHGLAPALKAAKLPRLTWHDLRHCCASLLISGGASVTQVSRVLGHSSPAVTLSTYAHVFAAAEHDEAMRDRMEQTYGELLR